MNDLYKQKHTLKEMMLHYAVNEAKKKISFHELNFNLDHGAIRTHKSLVPKTNALTIRPRGQLIWISQN